ncbi:c-type cytochrome biogenesis protein CcsB [Alkaliphilus peptidifermentans]|uniref:Cytochrome c-type biogenesis protein CcsB n=1 Tax=Alkaliphilus peptidifermentans DSM 18978 TaxID=1120976 RepID=A0A1G5BJM6_9FIRM|nr:c-type cytochrome biogenesis protein CcsB [Alkaliphilus peptidifermentans]SCX90335.1 cytochrome c-type biogenesis protein CcsB [Alkaliphilus peptidifermentans DSM 18978]
MLLESHSFNIAFLLYGLSMVLYLVFFILRSDKYASLASYLVICGLLFHTISLATRTVEASRLPLSNQYEFATSFSWGIAACLIAFEKKYRFKILGTFVCPIIVLVTFYAALQSREIRPLMPALQSNWIILHVSTAVISYGAFAVACGISVMFLIKSYLNKNSFIQKNMPSLEILDTISYRAIGLGFVMLTIVIVSGAIWADQAWGRYWQWDPKETWSFITWIIYAVYLHVRLSRGWKYKNAAWFAIIGFLSILFTYVGVNTLLTGYHSYAIIWLNML